MNKFCKIFVTIIILVFVCKGNSQVMAADRAIFIDTRLLIMAHPLFKAFDVKSGRFKGTSSEPFNHNIASRKIFIQKIKDIDEYLLKASEHLKEKVKNVPFKDRIKIEKDFLHEKKMLELKLEVMKKRIFLSRQVPTCEGMTPYSSIYPHCKAIKLAIMEVVEVLKSKYKTEVVIDVANLLPKSDNGILFASNSEWNLIRRLSEKEKVTDEQLKNWINEARAYWARKQGFFANIVPVGAVDVRLEALKLMEEKGKLYKIWDWEK